MKIPTSPNSLTEKWLTHALLSTGTINHSEVTAFEITQVSVHHGMSGQLVRLNLSYNTHEENAPLSIIAKFPATDPKELEMIFTTTYHYEREVRFYENIAKRVKLRTPKCYFSALDVNAREYILLLEDLAPNHCGDWAQGCSILQAETAIHQIAEFHAIWWEDPELKAMQWMPHWNEFQFTTFQQMYIDGWQPFLDKMDDKVTEKILKIGERLGKYLPLVLAEILEPPCTIAHFDYHLDNLLLPSEDNDTSIAVVDWQLLTFGRGTFDVAMFLAGNIDPIERHNNELVLLRMYHETIMNYDVKNYSFEQCTYDYRISMLYILARFVILIGTIGVTSEQEKRYCEIIIPRYIEAIVDLNTDQLLPH